MTATQGTKFVSPAINARIRNSGMPSNASPMPDSAPTISMSRNCPASQPQRSWPMRFSTRRARGRYLFGKKYGNPLVYGAGSAAMYGAAPRITPTVPNSPSTDQSLPTKHGKREPMLLRGIGSTPLSVPKSNGNAC